MIYTKRIFQWILFLPCYWISSFIVWIICSFLLKWCSTFNTFLYWLTVPEIFFIGGILFPIAIIIGLLYELDLPIKTVLIVLLLNNVLGIMWTLKNCGFDYKNTVDFFGIVYSATSMFGIVILLFTKDIKTKLNNI